jgi:hypothetical protein
LYVQPSGQRPVDPPLLDTLENFQRFWNSVNNVRAFVVTKISPIAYWISGGSIEAELRLSPRSESANGISDLPLWAHGHKQEKNQSLSKCPGTISTLFQSRWSDEFNEYFCGATVIEDTFLLVPVVSKSEYLSTNLRIWLARKYDFQTVGGTFEETFPELKDVTKYYQTVPLDNAHNILKSELLRSGNVVEFLGLKIPESVISTWGPIILVNIQLYLWLHLRACRERLTLSDPALNVAWVGIYPDFWSRLTSLISISLLPIGVVLYIVAWSGWFSWTIGLLIPELLLAFGSACIIWPLAQTRESDIGANPS